MAQSLRISGIEEESIVDGPGLRFVVFTQGCPHKCKGCHNPHTHDIQGGYSVTIQELLERFAENPLLSGITFSGGEPFLQPAPLVSLAREVKKLGKDVVVFTGYLLESLAQSPNPDVRELLALTDLLIDGPYMEEMRDLELVFRGSANQRLIDKCGIAKVL